MSSNEVSITVYLPPKYAKWLDTMKELGFLKKEVVKFSLDETMAMPLKELVSRLAVARLPPGAREEVSPS